MPAGPSASDVHVNIPLTNMSVAYIQDAGNFVADDIFPIVPVQRQFDSYLHYDKTFWFRDGARLRGPATESAGGGYEVDFNSTYACSKFAVHKDIDDDTRANAIAPLDMDRDATEFITQQLLIRREVQTMANLFGSGIWGLDLTGETSSPSTNQFLQWDQAGSTPVENVRSQHIRIASVTGFRPNKFLCAPGVYATLVDHPEMQERVKYTETGGFVDTQLLAKLFGVTDFLVGWAVKDSTAESTSDSSDSIGFIMGNSALLVYANPAPSILKPSGGYLFSWVGYLGAGNAGNRIKTFRKEDIAADRIEGEIAFDPKLIASDVGTMFNAAVGTVYGSY